MNVRDLAQLDHDALITFFKIDFRSIDVDQVLYFVNEGYENGDPVVWQGQTYDLWPISIEGEGASAQGQSPRPRLTVGNALVSSIIATLNAQHDDLIYVQVTVTTTYVKHLDGQSDANPNAEFPKGFYHIVRKISESELEIVYELEPFGLGNAQIPKRRVTHNCAWTYRSTECSFTGAPVADIDDNPLIEVEVNGVTINGTTATAANGAFSSVNLGDTVAGPGIAANTIVSFINASANTITLSKSASSQSGVRLFFAADICGRRSGSGLEAGSCKIRHGATVRVGVTPSSAVLTTPAGQIACFTDKEGAFVHTTEVNAGIPIARQIIGTQAGGSVSISSVGFETELIAPPPLSQTPVNPPGDERIKRYRFTTAAAHNIQPGERVIINGVAGLTGTYSIVASDILSTTEFTLNATGQAIQDITLSGAIATVTTWTPHGLTSGDSIFIEGTNEATLNGNSHTVTVVDETTFTLPSGVLGYQTRSRRSFQQGNYLQPVMTQAATGIAAENDEGRFYLESSFTLSSPTVSREGFGAILNAAVYSWAIAGEYDVIIGGNNFYEPEGLPYGGVPGAQLSST